MGAKIFGQKRKLLKVFNGDISSIVSAIKTFFGLICVMI